MHQEMNQNGIKVRTLYMYSWSPKKVSVLLSSNRVVLQYVVLRVDTVGGSYGFLHYCK